MKNVEAGDLIGRYELVREVAKGFPGALWLLNFSHEGQRMLALGRLVELSDAISETTWATLTESAWDAMEVDHECVASAADVVFEPSRLLTVYDYSEGEPLTVLDRLKTIQNTPIPVGVALRIAVDALDALEALHSTSLQLGVAGAFGGLVPDSILVGTDGCTRLLDIYVAGAASEQSELRMLPERVRYVAPEQFSGELVDARADVYAVACVLWELLANRRLHIGAPQAVERRVRLGQLPPLRPVAKVDDKVIAAVDKALKPDRRHRFDSAKALADELRRAAPDVAERSVVAQFVSRLADRQLATRRKVTEQSTIARLRDLLDSRPPPRAARRSVAPPRPALGARRVGATMLGGLTAPASLSHGQPSAPNGATPEAVLPDLSEPTAIGEATTAVAEVDAARIAETAATIVDSPGVPGLEAPPDSDGPTLAMPRTVLDNLVAGVKPTGVMEKKTQIGGVGALQNGTLLGMPAPEVASSFREALEKAAAEKASAESVATEGASDPASDRESQRVQSHRVVSLDPGTHEPTAGRAPGSVGVSASNPGSPGLAAPALPSEAIAPREVEDIQLAGVPKKRNWQPIIWACVGSVLTLLLTMLVMAWWEDDEDAPPTAASQASLAASAVPVAQAPKPVPAASGAEPAAATSAAEIPSGETDAPAQASASSEPPPVKSAPARKRKSSKKSSVFVPDGL